MKKSTHFSYTEAEKLRVKIAGEAFEAGEKELNSNNFSAKFVKQ